MAKRVIWFSTKAGILGGTIYYTNEIGVWGDSRQTTKLLEDVAKLTTPYFKENVPSFKTESLPTMAEVSSTVKSYWNKGVLNTTLFVADLPRRSVEWTNNGIAFISEQIQQQTEAPKQEN